MSTTATLSLRNTKVVYRGSHSYFYGCYLYARPCHCRLSDCVDRAALYWADDDTKPELIHVRRTSITRAR